MNFLSSGEEGSRPLSRPCPCSLHRRTKCASSSIASTEGGGQFVVTIKLGVCTSQAGIASALEATSAATAADYVQVVTGAGSLGMAYINGRPKVEGDLRLVLRLGTYFAPQF